MERCLEFSEPCEFPNQGYCDTLEKASNTSVWEIASEVPGNLTYKRKVAGRILQESFGNGPSAFSCQSLVFTKHLSYLSAIHPSSPILVLTRNATAVVTRTLPISRMENHSVRN